jgi:hypothetical protein
MGMAEVRGIRSREVQGIGKTRTKDKEFFYRKITYAGPFSRDMGMRPPLGDMATLCNVLYISKFIGYSIPGHH